MNIQCEQVFIYKNLGSKRLSLCIFFQDESRNVHVCSEYICVWTYIHTHIYEYVCCVLLLIYLWWELRVLLLV